MLTIEKVSMRKISTWIGMICIGVLLVSCDSTTATPLPTAVVIVRPLATVVISPTPDSAQLQATRAAATPTPLPPTATIIPSPTAFVGQFIGQADVSLGFQSFTQPILGEGNAAFQPTADNLRCGRPIDPRFVQIWQTTRVVSERLGCPIQEAFGFFGNFQLYERGAMYLQPSIRAVWAIAPQGAVGRYYYVEAPPPLIEELINTSDTGILPQGDFGSVWTTVQDVPTRLGFPITEEQEVAMAIQRFDGGTFLLDASAGQAFALAVDGTVYGPFPVDVTLIEPTPTAIDLQATPTTIDAP
jgi:hypothetical protein